MLESVRAGGLIPAPGFTWPDGFWSIDRAGAETVLRRWPDRRFELAASVDVEAIDPVSKEITLKLKRLELHEPNHGAKMHDYAVASDVTEASAAPAPLADGARPAASTNSSNMPDGPSRPGRACPGST